MKTRGNSHSGYATIALLLPLVVGIIQDIIPYQVYRQIGLLDVSAFVFAGVIFARYGLLHSRPIPRGLGIYFIVALWIFLTIGLTMFYPNSSFGNFSGAFLHYLRVIVLVGLAYFMGNYAAALVDSRVLCRMIAMLPLLGWILQQQLIHQANLDLYVAMNIVHLPSVTMFPSAGIFAWNSLSATMVLCLPVNLVLITSGKTGDKFLAAMSSLSIAIIIATSASRLAATLAVATLIYGVLLQRGLLVVRIMVIVSLIMCVIFFADIVEMCRPFLTEKAQFKISTYWDNLYRVRYLQITVDQFAQWVEGGPLFWFGDGKSMGHNYLVTVALKSGIGGLLLFVLLQYNILVRTLRSPGTAGQLARLIFFIMFAVNIVSDLIFTVPYFAYLSTFLLGWLSFADLDGEGARQQNVKELSSSLTRSVLR